MKLAQVKRYVICVLAFILIFGGSIFYYVEVLPFQTVQEQDASRFLNFNLINENKSLLIAFEDTSVVIVGDADFDIRLLSYSEKSKTKKSMFKGMREVIEFKAAYEFKDGDIIILWSSLKPDELLLNEEVIVNTGRPSNLFFPSSHF